MISGLLLGGLVPMVLFYNTFTESIHNFFHSFVDIVNALISLYYLTLLNTIDENRNNLIILLFAPIITFYKLIISSYSVYVYNSNSNVTVLDNEYLINYSLHGKDYSILIPKSKHYIHSQLLEATGYYTEEEIEEIEEEIEEDIEEEVEEVNKDEEEVKDITENDNEKVTPKVVQVQKDKNVTDFLIELLGPYNDFHNGIVSASPGMLGFDKIKVRYINEEFDEIVKEFNKDDVICF
jgi:heme/copper-type cytochrome/quinol oxidase subunit 4